MTILSDLQAALPGRTVADDGSGGFAFDQSLTQQEWDIVEAIIAPAKYRKRKARTDATNIPNWSTWTPAQWATYRDANVSAAQVNAITSLAEAKAFLLKLVPVVDAQAKMIIALRDHSEIVE